jgi:hypothetical protein
MARPRGSKNGSAAWRTLTDYPLKEVQELEHALDGHAAILEDFVRALGRLRRKETDTEYAVELVRTYPGAFITTIAGDRYICKNNRQRKTIVEDVRAWQLYSRMNQLHPSQVYPHADLEREYAKTWRGVVSEQAVGRLFAEMGMFRYGNTVSPRGKASNHTSGRRVLTNAYRRSDHLG